MSRLPYSHFNWMRLRKQLGVSYQGSNNYSANEEPFMGWVLRRLKAELANLEAGEYQP